VRALALLIASIGLADSINPSTVGPALLLAAGRRGAAAVAAFTAGAFAVSLAGGLLIVAGPGQLLVAALPHPGAHAKHLAEVIGGAVLLILAAGVWLARDRLTRRLTEDASTHKGEGSAFWLGAGIMLVELPTALPYFAAITAIVSSRAPLGAEVVLLLVFNVAFVSPLLAILAIRLFAGPRATAALERFGHWLRRQSAALLAALLAILGVASFSVGLGGLT
jgi:cytochrome c biogenesis protein CcdA